MTTRSPLTKAEAQTRIARLREEINRHNRLYYVEARPEISDREYDELYAELKALEAAFPDLITPDSPTQRVGGEPLKEFKHFRHLVPMLSLEKAEDLRELKLFESRLQKELPGERLQYVVEPKIDGVSISVHYHDGLLGVGVTRGDGTVGDDITANIKTIRDIPLRLDTSAPPKLLEVRGEAYIRPSDLESLNKRIAQAGEKPFPNTRNATAGSLKLLDPRIVAQRPLRAVFYAVGAYKGKEHRTHSEELEMLAAFGLPIPRFWWICDSIEAALEHAEELKRREKELPYEIDGVVIKLNDLRQAQRLGRTAKAPVSAIAYKPKHWLRQTETILKDIKVQVGRTGVLTPVAELEPVFLDGTLISRATLHNEEEIRRKDIRIGDTVVIERAGRVIPAVVRVVKEKRSGKERVFKMPSKCPVCGGPVTRKPMASGAGQEVALRCENLRCPAQKTRRLEYFAARRAMDIQGLGGVVADALVEHGLVNDPLDLFDLQEEQLAHLNLGSPEHPRMLGQKNAAKIVKAIQRSRTLPLSRWLFALAIPNVGEATAYQLASVHRDLAEVATSPLLRDIVALHERRKELKDLRSSLPRNQGRLSPEQASLRDRCERLKDEVASLEERVQRYQLPEVGPVVARSVLDFFASEEGQATLNRLKRLGINPQGEGAKVGAPAGELRGLLAGKTFVITGTLVSMTREEAAQRIRERGGNVAGSVSTRTSFLVVGADPGTNKTEAARRYGIPTLSEQEFLRMLASS